MEVWKKWLEISEKISEAQSQVRKEPKAYSSEKLMRYLKTHYDFRYNVISEVNEFRPKGESMSTFKVLGKRELNAICMEVQSAGIACWDRDLARYVHSTLVEAYHPFALYVKILTFI